LRGTRAAPGTSPITCPECKGRGVRSRNQGFFSLSEPCLHCAGTGQIVERACPTCSGRGRVGRTKRYTVRIPAGVKDGARIRLPGRGGEGLAGGPPGDLFVLVNVSPSSLFERRGDDFLVGRHVPRGRAWSQIECPRPAAAGRGRRPAGTAAARSAPLKGRGGWRQRFPPQRGARSAACGGASAGLFTDRASSARPLVRRPQGGADPRGSCSRLRRNSAPPNT
jgi:molecular chaperone DnaJ